VTAPDVAAPAVPAARTGQPASPARAVDRSGSLVELWFRGHTALVYAFLYLPILVVVVFAFNDTDRRVTTWDGFSFKWFEVALNDRVVQKALENSFWIALPNAFLATLFGTMAALGLQRVRKSVRIGYDALTYMSVIVPEIVIALATLIFFSSSLDIINPFLADLQGNPARPFKLNFGRETVIAGHVLFNTSLILLLVRARLSTMDRTLVEASYDLFATPWRTFRQITLPALLPAIVAGFLLAFTFSFDDYVISEFTSGPGSTTLPLFIFGQIKRGVTPETNAVATMMLAFTLGMLFLGQLILRWQNRRRGSRSGSMANIVAEQSGN
jgi:spermidine/putrescine transport system permease protein